MNTENTQRYSEVDLLSVQGRMGRKIYFFYSTLIPIIIFWITASLAGTMSKLESGANQNQASYLLLGLAVILTASVIIGLTIQRCHDFNKSGWLAVFSLIPLANIVFALIPGDNRLNSYGEIPEPAPGYISTVVTVMIGLIIALFVYSIFYFLDIKLEF